MKRGHEDYTQRVRYRTLPLPSRYLSKNEIQTSSYKRYEAEEMASKPVLDPLSSDIILLLTNKNSLGLQREVLESQPLAVDLITKDLFTQV